MGGPAGASVVVEGIPITSLWENKRIFFLCMGVSFATFQYGFDTGIINGLQAMQGFLKVFGEYNGATRKYGIETTFQQLITSLLQVGLIIASFSLGPFSRYFGRRGGFIAASLLSFASITIQILVTAQWPIYIARLMLGIANGAYVNLVVIYISETTPFYLRGPIVSIFQPMVSLGGLVGALVNQAFKTNLTRHSYQLQLVILYVVPLWFCIFTWFLPESPRWLAARGENEKAMKSLTTLRGNSVESRYVEMEMAAIRKSIEVENELKTGSTFMDMFRGTDLRRTGLCIGCAILHAASGLNVLVGYATVFFQVVGTTGDAFTNTTILKAVGVIGALISPFVARYFGRKTILVGGFAVTTVTILLVAIMATFVPKGDAAGRALMALICIYDAAYCIGCGPLAWVVAGEMPSNRLRSITFGFSMAIGFVFAWLTVFTTPYFINPTSPTFLAGKIAWIWFPSNLITLIWLIMYLPETQGRTLEELDEMFHNRVPARKFSQYKIRGLDGVQQDKDFMDEKAEDTQIEKVEVQEVENVARLNKV